MAAAKRKGGKSARKPPKKRRPAPPRRKPVPPKARKQARKPAKVKPSKLVKPAKPAARMAERAQRAKTAPQKPPSPARAAGRAQAAARVAPAPRPRRPRSRTTPSSGIPAAWFPQEGERPRPSSFIPAPPRAEAPSNVAAPPASSDRIVRPADLMGVEMAIRTFPVRVDLEQAGGRTRVHVFPETVSIRVGDGLEWDFRYLGGSDAIVEEVVIEFDKPAPFSKSSYRTRNPGSARPHRLLSGPAGKSSAGQTSRYTIRCFNLVKAEVATFQPTLVISES